MKKKNIELYHIFKSEYVNRYHMLGVVINELKRLDLISFYGGDCFVT